MWLWEWLWEWEGECACEGIEGMEGCEEIACIEGAVRLPKQARQLELELFWGTAG